MTRGRWWAAVGVAAAVVAIMLLIRFDVAHALLGGLILLIGVLIVAHLGLGQKVSLPRLPFDRRDGTRSEVSTLSWALYGNDGVTAQASRQLRQICRDGLTEAAIDVDTADGEVHARRVLGDRLTTFLVDPDAPAPDARTVRAAVTALEKLERTL